MFPLLQNALKLVKVLPTDITSIIQQNIGNNRLLTPVNHLLIPNCGFKVKEIVKRRCKDCFIVCKDRRWYNICKTHPRHKQMSRVKDEKNTWILSHATQSKFRSW